MAQMSQDSSYAGGSITETITHLEQQWASAAKNNDVSRVDPLLADVFVEMDSDGSTHNRSEILDRIKNDKWMLNQISDIKVTVHGNMAIATGVWQGKGTLADGKTIDTREHWLDTWSKNGKWQCVASASAPAKA